MNTITRKEIADAVGVSVDTVRRREKEWGLLECRSKASKRPQLFFRKKVTAALLRACVLVDV